MTDLVERLRWYTIADIEKLAPEAADKIERLRALLREALPFLSYYSPDDLEDRIRAALGDDATSSPAIPT